MSQVKQAQLGILQVMELNGKKTRGEHHAGESGDRDFLEWVAPRGWAQGDLLLSQMLRAVLPHCPSAWLGCGYKAVAPR